MITALSFQTSAKIGTLYRLTQAYRQRRKQKPRAVISGFSVIGSETETPDQVHWQVADLSPKPGLTDREQIGHSVHVEKYDKCEVLIVYLLGGVQSTSDYETK